MDAFGKNFLKHSSPQNMKPTPHQRGETQPPLEMPYHGDLIFLPSVQTMTMPRIDLEAVMTYRMSQRKYESKAISREALAYALYYTQGVKKTIAHKATFRTVPSAGARHAFETYLYINKVEGIDSGLYRYIAFKHALVLLDVNVDAKTLKEACLGQRMVEDASVTFFWVADVQRMTYRYGERGYRYLFLDAGHIGQNLYLIAEQLQLGTCAIGAFDDDALNKALSIDIDTMFVAYAAPLGVVLQNKK